MTRNRTLQPGVLAPLLLALPVLAFAVPAAGAGILTAPSAERTADTLAAKPLGGEPHGAGSLAEWVPWCADCDISLAGAPDPSNGTAQLLSVHLDDETRVTRGVETPRAAEPGSAVLPVSVAGEPWVRR